MSKETKWIGERQYEKRLEPNGEYVIMVRGRTHVGVNLAIEDLAWTDLCTIGRQLSSWSAHDEATEVLRALREHEERHYATQS